ncbi:MAG: hypothetical protein FWG29_06605 [Treponema sp.]|nr:hypothetical protein [Treponema sp.]
MTETKQVHSLTDDQEQDIDISFNCYKAVKEAKADARENMQILESVCDSLNNLCKKLDKLDNLTENIIFGNNNKKSPPQTEPFD